ncbi:hypothetical protein NL676_034903 [Syzygium grande]|nr:hypothetical protein NL676_034903 [Syzygium grande]
MRNTATTGARAALVFLFLSASLAAVAVLGANYVPTDKILLNCGADPQTTDTDGRVWTLDIGSKFLSYTANSITAAAATQDPSVPQVPYMTARIFPSNFTLSFPWHPVGSSSDCTFIPLRTIRIKRPMPYSLFLLGIILF